MSNLEDMLRIHKIRPKGVIHLGAHTGQELPVYARWDVPVIWVEANPDLIPELTKNVLPYRGHQVFCAAACDTDDQVRPFYLASNGGSSSLLKMKKHREFYPEVMVNRAIDVRTATVDGLVKRAARLPVEYDFLNMDIQGAELLALEGMRRQLLYLRWIYSEVNYDELYEGCAIFEGLTLILNKKGFQLAGLRQEEGAKGWGEALYERSTR